MWSFRCITCKVPAISWDDMRSFLAPTTFLLQKTRRKNHHRQIRTISSPKMSYAILLRWTLPMGSYQHKRRPPVHAHVLPPLDVVDLPAGRMRHFWNSTTRENFFARSGEAIDMNKVLFRMRPFQYWKCIHAIMVLQNLPVFVDDPLSLEK